MWLLHACIWLAACAASRNNRIASAAWYHAMHGMFMCTVQYCSLVITRFKTPKTANYRRLMCHNTVTTLDVGCCALLPWWCSHVCCRKANLSPEVQAWAEEVALDEQGHVRMVRQVGLPNSVPSKQALAPSLSGAHPLLSAGSHRALYWLSGCTSCGDVLHWLAPQWLRRCCGITCMQTADSTAGQRLQYG